MKLHFRNDEYIAPPGSLTEILSHPYYKHSKSISLSIFNDHRYAFFFWNKWTQDMFKNNKANYPPSLVSLDWHQDLVYPTASEKNWLENLNLASNKDVALYCWANLSGLNDTHILSAAYLNLIGDIYVHCRQGKYDEDWKDEFITDRYNNIHTIKKFRMYEDIENCLLKSDEADVYFDIDLDFFTISNPLQIGNRGGKYTYLPEWEIKRMLSAENSLMKWLFERLQGITIALEPEHTGGLLKSQRLLGLIDKTWFKPSLFTSYPGKLEKRTQWRHLRI